MIRALIKAANEGCKDVTQEAPIGGGIPYRVGTNKRGEISCPLTDMPNEIVQLITSNLHVRANEALGWSVIQCGLPVGGSGSGGHVFFRSINPGTLFLLCRKKAPKCNIYHIQLCDRVLCFAYLCVALFTPTRKANKKLI
jgi:hypothetical protein